MNNIFDWDHFFIYLSGPIDFAADGGRGWRKDWIEKLENIGVTQSHILNPCNKPLKGAQFNLDDEHRIIADYRRKKDWDKLYDVMSQIVHMDLRFVDLSSLVLANFPKKGRQPFEKITSKFESAFKNLFTNYSNDQTSLDGLLDIHQCFYDMVSEVSSLQVPTYGTMHELVVARQQKKPVMIVWEGGKITCSGWVQWLVRPQNIFDTVDDLIAHLDSIRSGNISYDVKSWLMLDI